MASSTTRLVTLRLPNEVVEVAGRRAEKMGIGTGEYLRKIVVVQVMRKHGKR